MYKRQPGTQTKGGTVVSDGKVEVEILEPMPKTGPNAFRVQETGKEKKGILNHGTPPTPLPAAGDKVRVFRESTFSEQNPTYRWSKPEAAPLRRPDIRKPRR